jgi:hypothetical protein
VAPPSKRASYPYRNALHRCRNLEFPRVVTVFA